MNLESIKKVKRSKPVTVLDGIILAALAAAVSLSAWLIFRRPAVTVTVKSGDFEKTYSISQNVTVRLDGLTVVIEDGCVWVTDANCPDKTCEHSGKISRAGQSIVCLPNGVTVTVNGESDLQWEVGG